MSRALPGGKDLRMGRRDDEQERYRGDVIYEVWRNGGNVDRISDDRVSDSFYEGYDSDAAAERELSAMRPPHDPEPDFE